MTKKLHLNFTYSYSKPQNFKQALSYIYKMFEEYNLNKEEISNSSPLHSISKFNKWFEIDPFLKNEKNPKKFIFKENKIDIFLDLINSLKSKKCITFKYIYFNDAVKLINKNYLYVEENNNEEDEYSKLKNHNPCCCII